MFYFQLVCLQETFGLLLKIPKTRLPCLRNTKKRRKIGPKIFHKFPLTMFQQKVRWFRIRKTIYPSPQPQTSLMKAIPRCTGTKEKESVRIFQSTQFLQQKLANFQKNTLVLRTNVGSVPAEHNKTREFVADRKCLQQVNFRLVFTRLYVLRAAVVFTTTSLPVCDSFCRYNTCASLPTIGRVVICAQVTQAERISLDTWYCAVELPLSGLWFVKRFLFPCKSENRNKFQQKIVRLAIKSIGWK